MDTAASFDVDGAIADSDQTDGDDDDEG